MKISRTRVWQVGCVVKDWSIWHHFKPKTWYIGVQWRSSARNDFLLPPPGGRPTKRDPFWWPCGKMTHCGHTEIGPLPNLMPSELFVFFLCARRLCILQRTSMERKTGATFNYVEKVLQTGFRSTGHTKRWWFIKFGNELYNVTHPHPGVKNRINIRLLGLLAACPFEVNLFCGRTF